MNPDLALLGMKHIFEVALWCCHDSNEECADACVYINDCENQIASPFFSGVCPQDGKDLSVAATNSTIRDTAANETFGMVFGAVPIECVAAVCAEYSDFTCEPNDGSGFGDPVSCVLGNDLRT